MRPSRLTLAAALRAASLATLLAALFAAGAPLALAAGGRWPDPARLAGEVAAFAHADSASPPPAGAIMFAGSSSIRMWQPRLARDFAPLTVLGRGFGGSTMRDLAAYLDPLVLAPHPRAVVLYGGDNDLLEGLSPEAIRAVFDSIVVRVHAALPDARVYVLPVKPSPSRRTLWPAARALNRSLRAACARDTMLRYVDVASPMLDQNEQPRPELFLPDSLHMNDRGYDVWRGVVAPVLEAREARFETPHPRSSDQTNEGADPTSLRPGHVTVVRHNELVVDPRHPISTPSMTDCNWNGISDSVDIAEGTADDANRNGVIDSCEPDTTLCAQRPDCRDRWRLLAALPDTSHFWSAYASDGTVLLQFTVPPPGARVSLTANSADGERRIQIVDPGMRQSGAYEFSWDKKDPSTGRPAPPGLYRLELTVGRRSYTRLVHWAQL